MRTRPEPRPKPLGPEPSPESLIAAFNAAEQGIRQAVREMRDAGQTMFKSFAELIGQPGETDRTRLIFAGLVRFANEVFENNDFPLWCSLCLRASMALCVRGDDELEDIQGRVYMLELFDDISFLKRNSGLSEKGAFSALALVLQPQLRRLLAWIADPNRTCVTDRGAALSFLLENSSGETARYEFEPNDNFDDSGNEGYPLFYWKRPASFQTIAAPIASYIFQRLEKYHDGSLSFSDAVPIVLCRRDGCGMLSLSFRSTKDFCSDSCRALNRQKERRVEHAAYMRDYRRKNYTRDFPRNKRK